MLHAMQRRKFLGHTIAGGSTMAMPLWLHAQPTAKLEKWPSSNIKLIVPYPAGGGVDATSRKLAELLAPRIGVPVIVQNTPGAAGLIGSRAIAMAPPDGSTVGYVNSTLVTQQSMGAKIDILNDFTPIVPRIQASVFLVVVNAGSPYMNLQGLITAMKADPQKFTYGSAGLGSPEHIIFEKLAKAVPGIGAVHVPFKGTIEGVGALMGKQIDFMVCLTSTARGAIESGKLRALATTSMQRSRVFPDVPTVSEAGVPGFAHASWSGIFGPKGLHPQLAERMRVALNQVVQSPEFTSFAIGNGAEPLREEPSPDAFHGFLVRSLEAETALMKQLDLKL